MKTHWLPVHDDFPLDTHTSPDPPPIPPTTRSAQCNSNPLALMPFAIHPETLN
jgi:hypothetical protein